MGLAFEIRYNPSVLKRDIPSLSKTVKERVVGAINTRLMVQPVLYSLPLKGSLKGHRKLRVGDYRVVFTMEKNVVYVEAILHRSLVYKEMMKRKSYGQYSA